MAKHRKGLQAMDSCLYLMPEDKGHKMTPVGNFIDPTKRFEYVDIVGPLLSSKGYKMPDNNKGSFNKDVRFLNVNKTSCV